MYFVICAFCGKEGPQADGVDNAMTLARLCGWVYMPSLLGQSCPNCANKHKMTFSAVASGAGRIVCSCGWKSSVRDDGDLFIGQTDITKEFFEHLKKEATGG